MSFLKGSSLSKILVYSCHICVYGFIHCSILTNEGWRTPASVEALHPSPTLQKSYSILRLFKLNVAFSVLGPWWSYLWCSPKLHAWLRSGWQNTWMTTIWYKPNKETYTHTIHTCFQPGHISNAGTAAPPIAWSVQLHLATNRDVLPTPPASGKRCKITLNSYTWVRVDRNPYFQILVV